MDAENVVTDQHHPTPASDRRHLAEMVVDLLRLVRVLRAEYRACAELLGETLDMLSETQAELDRVRERYHALLDERRREREQRRRAA